MTTPKLIILEGPDGVGKSSAATNLRLRIGAQLAEAKVDSKAVVLRDPGTTDFGEEIRQIVLDPKRKIDNPAIFFSFTAARAELLALARQHLNEGHVVIMDRLWPSTVAYQGYGSAIPMDIITTSSRYLLEYYIPLTQDIHYCFLTASRELRRTRLQGYRGKDRFESKPADFFDRLDTGYLVASRMAADFSKHWATVHGLSVETLDEDHVVDAIMAGLPAKWTLPGVSHTNRIAP